jgi:hypothetical protein
MLAGVDDRVSAVIVSHWLKVATAHLLIPGCFMCICRALLALL